MYSKPGSYAYKWNDKFQENEVYCTYLHSTYRYCNSFTAGMRKKNWILHFFHNIEECKRWRLFTKRDFPYILLQQIYSLSTMNLRTGHTSNRLLMQPDCKGIAEVDGNFKSRQQNFTQERKELLEFLRFFKRFTVGLLLMKK